MQNLYDNMAEYGYDLTKMPFVIQYNKRDLPNAAPISELQAALNPGWEVTRSEQAARHAGSVSCRREPVEQLPTGEWIERAPYFEAVAVTGDGVFDTLKAVSKLCSSRSPESFACTSVNLPNAITVGRIAATPLIAALAASIRAWLPRLSAFVLFIVGAVTDYIDGQLARDAQPGDGSRAAARSARRQAAARRDVRPDVLAHAGLLSPRCRRGRLASRRGGRASCVTVHGDRCTRS